ncbi:MAG TPA: alpha-glucuronidase family glycosyl hydrolase, partial [Terriglobales bacterium]|nr:alpha-glucuronidase family glycosyl hydrolase [Terriglobales bacterium]
MTKSFTSILILLTAVAASAETGRDAWLRYVPVRNQEAETYREVVVLGHSEVVRTAEEEVMRGFRGMLGRELRVVARPSRPAIVLGTAAYIKQTFPEIQRLDRIGVDGFQLVRHSGSLLIIGGNDSGVLYGAFSLLRRIALRQPMEALENPSAPIRWTNEWDNLDGIIERGYGGRSIFFADGDVAGDLTRAKEYARLLASLG